MHRKGSGVRLTTFVDGDSSSTLRTEEQLFETLTTSPHTASGPAVEFDQITDHISRADEW